MVDPAREVITDAIRARIFPAAAIEVGSSSGVLWRDAFGTLTFDAGSPSTSLDTLFDLASLTKPLVTATLAMSLLDAGRLRLDEPVSAFFPEWRSADRQTATVQDLLEHAAGLPARLVDIAAEDRREFEHDICTMPLEYPVRTQSVYSDLGFLLLGFLIADRGGTALGLQFDTVLDRLALDKASLGFALRRDRRRLAAPTLPMDDDRRRGRMLVGEAHDTYAAALRGVAGHAGLFGTAGAVGAFARLTLRGALGDSTVPAPLSPALIARMTTKTTVPGSSRALGWDTMLPTSSCGTHMSASAFGHVGFTGTSLSMNPACDRYFVLLTNRVLGAGSLEDIRAVRRAFHDALAEI